MVYMVLERRKYSKRTKQLLCATEVILHTNNIRFIGGIHRIGMLPNLGNCSPTFFNSNEAMTLTHVQPDNLAHTNFLLTFHNVRVAGGHTGSTGNQLPNFCAPVMVLPGQSLARFNNQD